MGLPIQDVLTTDELLRFVRNHLVTDWKAAALCLAEEIDDHLDLEKNFEERLEEMEQEHADQLENIWYGAPAEKTALKAHVVRQGIPYIVLTNQSFWSGPEEAEEELVSFLRRYDATETVMVPAWAVTPEEMDLLTEERMVGTFLVMRTHKANPFRGKLSDMWRDQFPMRTRTRGKVPQRPARRRKLRTD